ncbi:MAG TPA: ferrochelatase [Paludibacter sp.]|nr:ferrochelatase [Paludibacter sp.]
MTGVLLVNMGSPLSKKEMRQFLFNMFTDKAILPFPALPRTLLAFIISTFRHGGSWKKYQQISGSKLKESMKLINSQLAAELGAGYEVTSAYSYSKPSIQEGIEELRSKGITTIKVITMYPHSAFSTTESVKTDLANVQKKYPELKMTELGTYGENELFINYWVDNVQKSIDKQGYKTPTLLFSAHAIPQYNVDAGDTYVDEINASAKLIAGKLEVPYRVAFQSKIGKVKWVDPDTKDCLKNMKAENIDEIMLVPVSFVNENLETAYDQGVEIVPYGKNELGIKHICRVKIPASHPLLIATLKQLLANA